VTIINDKKPSKEYCTMFTDLSLQVALGISLYRSPIAGAKFIDLSLQITPYKEDGKKYSLK